MGTWQIIYDFNTTPNSMKYTPKDGFPYYYELVQDKDLNQLFFSTDTFMFLQSIGKEKAAHRYAPNKWSIKQIVGHIADHERIKMFRAFQLSRKQEVQLWGYDQESLVNNSRFDELSLQQLINDLLHVRQASQSFIGTLSEHQLQLMGQAKHHTITLKDFLKSIIGHEVHHINIVKDRYL